MKAINMYHYINPNGVVTPATPEVFMSKIQSGEVTADTLVWREGLADFAYIAARTIPELKILFPAAVAPPPVVVPVAPPLPIVYAAVLPTIVSETPTDKKEDKKLHPYLLLILQHKWYAAGGALLFVLMVWFATRSGDLSSSSVLQNDKENKHELVTKYFSVSKSQSAMEVATGTVNITFSNTSSDHTFQIKKVRVPIVGAIGFGSTVQKDRRQTIIIPPGEQVTKKFNFDLGDSCNGEPTVSETWITVTQK